MQLHYWAGHITPEIIADHPNIPTWAVSWVKRAIKAHNAGNELVVFEVPKGHVLACVGDMESLLQKYFPVPEPPAIDPMLFDLSFMQALFPTNKHADETT